MHLLLRLGLLMNVSWVAGLAQPASAEVPREWVDPATGHRVRRLSQDGGTASLYFHQDAFLRDGRRMLVTTSQGIATLDIESGAVRVLIPRE